MSISQKSLNKGFALGVLGLYAFGFGATLGVKTAQYNRIIGDYSPLVQNIGDTRLRVSGGGNSISNVTGQEAYLYYADTFNFSVQYQGSFSVYAGNYSTRTFTSTEIRYNGYINSQQDYLDVCNNAISFNTYYSNYDFVIVAEDLGDVFLVRFYVKSNSPIENIEVLSSNSNSLFYGMGFGTISSSGLLESDDTWVLLHDSLSYSSTTESGTSSGNVYFTKFNPFYIWYDMPNNTTNLNLTFNLFGSFNATYQNGYEIGYSSGYTDGYNDGQNYVLDNLDEFDLYDYATYLAYGQSKYNEGAEAGGHILSLSGVMNTIFTAPINMFMQIFRSGAFVWTMPTGEVLDLGGLMTFFLTIGIALAIVRLIMKVGGK